MEQLDWSRAHPRFLVMQIYNNELNQNSRCTICLENFEENEEFIQLSCQHLFHKLCILSWLHIVGTLSCL